MTSLSGVTFVLFASFSSSCFRLSRGASFNRPSICRRPVNHTCTISAFSLYGEYVVGSFLPDGGFLPCGHGLDILHQFV